MQCPRCHAENREGRRFCGECGLSLASTCSSCGFLNEGSEKFCGGGGRFSERLEAPHPRAARAVLDRRAPFLTQHIPLPRPMVSLFSTCLHLAWSVFIL